MQSTSDPKIWTETVTPGVIMKVDTRKNVISVIFRGVKKTDYPFNTPIMAEHVVIIRNHIYKLLN